MKTNYDNQQSDWKDDYYMFREIEMYIDEESIRLWDEMNKENPRLKC